ncbi:MAG: hypothetical protein L3K23_02990 [Thermoplasmata archaeon]|nr:hypothetical protein [Thermoplasmata archaeon]
MARCKDVFTFFNQVSTKSAVALLPEADAALLAQLNLVQFLTGDQYRQVQSDAANLNAEQMEVAQASAQRTEIARELSRETERTHSILFHLEGKQKQSAELQRAAQLAGSYSAAAGDLAKKQQEFGRLVGQRTLLDTLTPYGDRYVALSGLGLVEMRDLGVRLYRAGDIDFKSYWDQEQTLTEDLNDLALAATEYFARLFPALPGADRSYLWGISIGLPKLQSDPTQGTAAFLNAYRQVSSLSSNVENLLMASEILLGLPRPLAEEFPALTQLLHEVKRLTLPSESALGVASILLVGRRADGTVATPSLQEYLTVTRSYESAALLAIVNLPVMELAAKFQGLRTMFAGWGYEPSEDVELSSAYLAVSELPIEGIGTKLAIIAKGLSAYLEYPLVAASVLASLSTLEANETLNLLERAYDIIGRRTMPMSQGEIITLAVRMLHGVRNELVGPLDTTAPPPPTPAALANVYGPRFFFVPIVVAHNSYFSSYSGLGGAHPGHVHGFGGGGGGFAG